MAGPVTRQVGVAGHPAAVVDAVAGAGRAAETGQQDDPIAGRPFLAGTVGNRALEGAGEQQRESEQPRHQASHDVPPSQFNPSCLAVFGMTPRQL
jgi:hypothetical protein